MFDLILGWMVVILPSLFGIGIALIDDRIRKDWKRRWGVIAFGFALSALTWIQMSRAAKAADRDRNEAITQTSERVSAKVSESVSKSVTKALSEQYQGTINTLQGQIGTLQAQLESQGKKVDVIGQSNIVTGKNPVKVEVTNPPAPGSSGEEKLQVRVAEVSVEPRPEYGKGATELILTTNKVMDGAHVSVHCKTKINSGTAVIAGGGVQMGAGGMIDSYTFGVDISSPNWSPTRPLVITLYFDGDSWKGCDITLLS